MANTVTLHTLGYEKRSIDEFIELLVILLHEGPSVRRAYAIVLLHR